ncbi:MAG: B12-binding domain-containing protein [Bacteroidetes bacterium]|nr:B12-binding domain-containing protein [Bacteroidota bacterium]
MEKRCVYDPLTTFMEHYSGTAATQPAATLAEDAPIEERLKRRIVDGDRIGLDRDLDAALKIHDPLHIINAILLDGMKTVGELFGSGQMQLPFVLQSAETMKAAVAHLEPYMDKVDGAAKGSIVLATVKGDVHDIGKNLVDIILTNNGYRVVNLGIKVPVETMLSAVENERAEALGMSGLLVKSTLIMKENLELMQKRGLRIPVILGGAALTRRFVEEDLRPLYSGTLRYAKDAFDGLRFMDDVATGSLASDEEGQSQPDIDDTPERSGMEAKIATVEQAATETVSGDIPARKNTAGTSPSRSAVTRRVPVPTPPFLGSRTVRDIPIEKVYEYINEVALIRGQWQFRRGKLDEESYQRELETVVHPRLEELKLRMKRERILQPAVVYGYFPCASEGNDLIVYRPREISADALHAEWPKSAYTHDELVEWQRFAFPRQSSDRYLCIADFFRAADEGAPDVCAFHLVTMGNDASDYTAALFANDRYQDYLYVHGLSVECAEALAEYWHKSIRTELGIAGKDAKDVRRLFSQGYQGSRYSFGYPACPNLEDQVQLFELLRPERIGITLTEEFQLVPEQSTSAIIVHHPEAKYFNVK